ncbi:MAG: YggS family pyridoxal phosphate-dependent enzyme [Candidatus Nanopelagicus sp.]|jgi:pyridoxal phosphate enzyme (YggS family)
MSRKDQILSNLESVKEKISAAAQAAGRSPSEITLIAVTKTFPVSDLEILYELGVRNFGENRDQEAAPKVGVLPADITWHFQGGIQSNKLKSISNWASVIHSVDKFKYAQMISQFSVGKTKEIFIQVSLDTLPQSREGVDPADLMQLAEQIMSLPNLEVKGLMAVAPLDQPTEQAFVRLQQIQQKFIQLYPAASSLSSGMSGDYELAISLGATHVRIGSSILGNRSPIK